MSLKGGAELRARMKAIRGFFKPYGKLWAEDVRGESKRHLAQTRDSGRTERSVRVRNASQRKATVVAHYAAYFIDAGVKRHEIKPRTRKTLRFESGGNIVFTKRVNHPGYRARPFRQRIAEAALQRHSMVKTLIEEWNKAGGRARFRR